MMNLATLLGLGVPDGGAPRTLKKVDKPCFDDSEIGKIFASLNQPVEGAPEPKNILKKAALTAILDSKNHAVAAQQILSSSKSSSKPVCAKVLTPKDIGFKCLDCEKDPTCIICKECFDNADHRGHRIIVQKSVSGCCDCGDPDAWAESGFCKNHPGYANYKPSTSVSDLPVSFRGNFTRVISKAFYYSALTVEKAVAECSNSNALKSGIIDVISAIDECGNQSIPVYSLVCQILQEPYPDCMLYHDCENLKQTEYSSKLKRCTCSLLEILFRNTLYFSQKEQEVFESFMIKLFLNYQFKQYMAEIYIKMAFFIHNHVGLLRSRLSSLSVQLFTSEEFSVFAIKSRYFSSLISNFELMVASLPEIIKKGGNVFGVFIDFYQLFQYVGQKSSTRQLLLKSPGFIEGLIRCLIPLHHYLNFVSNKDFPMTIDEFGEHVVMVQIESNLVKLCNNIFLELNVLESPEIKLKFQRIIGTTFKEIFSTLQTRNGDYGALHRSFHIPIHRAFSQFIKVGAGSLSTQTIKSFLQESLGLNGQEFSNFCSEISKEVIQTIGFIRDQEKRCWTTFGPRLDPYVQFYFSYPQFKFHDLDFFLLQSVSRFVPHEQFFRVFLENYSLYGRLKQLLFMVQDGNITHEPLKAYIQKQNSEDQDKLIRKLDEIVSLFLQLCIDDVEYANLLHKSLRHNEELRNDPNTTSQLHPIQNVVYKRLLINVFQYKSAFDLKGLRKLLGTQLLDEKINLEVPLLEVATFDGKTKTFVVKSEYKDMYEPFGCMRDPSLQVDIIENLKSKFKNTEHLDLVVGKHSFLYEIKENPLYEIQNDLFSPQFMSAFKKILKVCLEYEKMSSFFCRPLLKIFHLGLFHIKNKSLESLRNILTDNSMVESLQRAKECRNFSDYEPAIDKMLTLISQLTSIDEEIAFDVPSLKSLDSIDASARQTSKNNLDAVKKKQMELRMKMMQSQNKFMKQYGQNMSEEVKMDEGDRHELVCYICHGQIEEGSQPYGVPAFACCSNMYDFAVFQTEMRSIVDESAQKIPLEFQLELSRMDLKSQHFDRYLQLSSCHHFMHKSCFESDRKQSKETNFHFNNDIEYFCKVCRRLSNVFIESYLSKNIHSSDIDSDQKIQIESVLNSVDDLIAKVKSISTHKEVLNTREAGQKNENVDMLFDTLIMLELFMGENMKASEKNGLDEEKEDEILELTEKIFEYAIKTIDFIGVKHFLNKHFKIYKSLKGMYQRFYSQYYSGTKQRFSDKKYEKLVSLLELIKTKPANTYDSKADKSRGPENFITINLDEFLYNSLVHMMTTSPSSQDASLLKDVLSRFCHLMILHTMVQAYARRAINTKDLNINAEGFISALQEKEFQAELVSSLLPLMRRLVVLGCILDSEFNEKEAKHFEKDNFYEDFDELSFYLQHSLFKMNVDTLMSEEILKRSFLSKDILNDHIVGLTHTILENLSQLPLSFVIGNKEITLHLIDLPDSFYDLSTFYIDRKCELCKQHSQVGSKCVCLICEQVVCSSACQKVKGMPLGNLNSHAAEYHAGTSAFLNIESGAVFLINTPKNIDFGPLYVDKFGQKFDNKHTDWKNYSLDRTMYNKLKETIDRSSIPQAVCHHILKSEKKFIDGAL